MRRGGRMLSLNDYLYEEYLVVPGLVGSVKTSRKIEDMRMK
ncbi:hypothetical protein J5U21_01785 [Saccharolobus shibatae]|uniref:Uncharacterized protein n=1 Tax=Saccharolobus shibatae TaxID=2286 RepID=A0A8F5BVA8_9CREN|nr:hypothetical protein J5U21_01785 [Saccharolobus shibatae]